MAENKICPKCKGTMNTGDFTGNGVNWKKNREQTFLKEETSNVISYVCEECGFMETYVK